MYTRALAFDPKTTGIIVIVIHSGWMRTDMDEATLYPN